jgi:SsrA-binding protein
MTGKKTEQKLIADNRKARFNYFIEDSLEAGLVLTGSEVKSLREGRCNIGEAYAAEDNGELYLINAHIPQYAPANRFNHEPLRKRKILLKKREVAKLAGLSERAGYTLVPLKLYFNDRGIVKLELGLGKGKKAPDKRDTIKGREWEREQGRLMRQRG